MPLILRLQEEVISREDAENNLQSFRQVGIFYRQHKVDYTHINIHILSLLECLVRKLIRLWDGFHTERGHVGKWQSKLLSEWGMLLAAGGRWCIQTVEEYNKRMHVCLKPSATSTCATCIFTNRHRKSLFSCLFGTFIACKCSRIKTYH